MIRRSGISKSTTKQISVSNHAMTDSIPNFSGRSEFADSILAFEARHSRLPKVLRVNARADLLTLSFCSKIELETPLYSKLSGRDLASLD